MRESAILRDHRLTLGQSPHCLIYRNQVGIASYPGGIRVPYGLTRGAADLIGIRTLTITAAHVGCLVGQFLAVETKTLTGRLTDEQRLFLELVERRGGIAIVGRDAQETAEIVAHSRLRPA